MGFGKALGLTLLGGAAIGVIANLLDDDKTPTRNVYIVTSDIAYSGINLTQEARSLVNGLRRKEIITNEKWAHWSIQVGDGDDARYFEIMSFNLGKRQELQPTRWGPGQVNKITGKKQVGVTSHSDSEINKICNDVIKAKPTYHLLVNNCQDFVRGALKEICNVKETISEEDEKAFATIFSAFILLPIVGPAALVPLISGY